MGNSIARRNTMSSDKPENKNSTEKQASAVKKKTASKKTTDNSTQAILALKEGLISLQKQNDARMSEQENKLAELYKGLESAFIKIHQDTDERKIKSSSSFDQLSDTIIRSSDEMRKEYEEMERLQEKRLKAENQQYTHSITRTKIIAIPAIVLAFAGFIHMFYTVNVMEKAMSQMSKDMTYMRKDMSSLTHNISGMRQDMNVMTHNVAPAMNGMRRMMPWSP